MQVVQLRGKIANVERRAGKFVSEDEVVLKLEGNADVYKPNGEPLCMLRREAIPKELQEKAYPALHEMRKLKTDNRSKYAGSDRVHTRYGDGTLSKSTRTVRDGKPAAIASAIVGYFDRQGGRFPFCRETYFTGSEPALWAGVVPMVEHVAKVFAKEMPTRFEKQSVLARKTPPEFVIGKTPFTTLTVNNNVRGAIHQDKGDYKEGFGIISVVRRGEYTGGWLVFPEYAVAADLQDGDIIFFNSHDWHGVTALRGLEGAFERISIVYYFRTRMAECLPAVQEQKRAQMRYGAL